MKRNRSKETSRQLSVEAAAKRLAHLLNESGRFDASVQYSALSEAVYLEIGRLDENGYYLDVFTVRFADHETVNWRRGNGSAPAAELPCLPSQVKAVGKFLGIVF